MSAIDNPNWMPDPIAIAHPPQDNRHATPQRRPGEWIQTYTGQRFWPLNPRPEDIDIMDIAHALSQTCRYAGHCREFYSVAQHSVLVSEALERQATEDYALQLWGLLHDASEAYLPDIPRPLKPAIPQFAAIEHRVLAAVATRYSISRIAHEAAVKRVDDAILADEAPQLFHDVVDGWTFLEKPLGITITPREPYYARHAFLKRFHALVARRGGAKRKPAP